MCVHTHLQGFVVPTAQVTYDAKQADPRHTKTGKLVVTSQHSSGSSSRGQTPPPISWVYYLKGVASL